MPFKPQQMTFKRAPAFEKYFRTEHGGSLYGGRRKEARPLAAKRPLHLVLRSTRARGRWSFLHPENSDRVESLARRVARDSKSQGLKIIQVANSGNHLHLVIQGKTRQGLQYFFRTYPALLARLITGARRGSPRGRFWDRLVYTRLVTWGRELIALRRYLLRNDLEAVGFVTRQERALTFAEALARRGLRLVG